MSTADPWGQSQWTIDHAPLGFGALAAHGHADTLAVWLSIEGLPVFVEAGTYLYHSNSHWRDYFRSTRVHNTLVVEATDSSKMRGAFNWDKRARADGRLIRRTNGACWSIEAAHDGYLREFGCTHLRTLRRIGPGHFEIIDQLTGDETHRVNFGLLLAPDISVKNLAQGWELVRNEKSFAKITFSSGFSARSSDTENGQADAWISPAFFQRAPARQLVVEGELGAKRALKVHIRSSTSAGSLETHYEPKGKRDDQPEQVAKR